MVSVLQEQHERWKAAQSRLGLGPKVPRVKLIAAVPDVSSTYRRPDDKARPKRNPVGYGTACSMVSDATDIPAVMIETSSYAAAVGARHFLWCVLYDGGWAYSSIALKFGSSPADVKMAVLCFRAFQAEKAKLA